MPVLAGDIGGTKTLLQIADFDANRYRVIAQQRYENSDYDSLTSIVDKFIASAHPPRLSAACFGVAGPINATASGQQVKLTNLPWVVDSGSLAAAFAIPKVKLINDFQAAGYGMEVLTPQDLVTLQEGVAQPHGTRALIGAGTGLGQGMMVWQGQYYEPRATEGGHVDFAPTDALQIELLEFLIARYGHVSYERVVSGQGLVNIYQFLQTRCGQACESDILDHDDKAAAIASTALSAQDPLAEQAVDLFVRIYGAQAGNLALTVNATGGVYIAGGIAPKMLKRLTAGAFMDAFKHKGRMSHLVARMPVHVIVNPAVGLMGTALAASRL